MYQNGAEPFTYDPANEGEIGINLNSHEIKEVLDYWAGLVEKGLVGTEDQFTPEYISGVIGGDYATYLSAAWAPGYLQGAGVGEGADAGVWATAPLPQWDPANPVAINWGGSAFSVTSQANDPELAAKVAFGVYADEASLDDGWQNQIIFPLNVNVLNDPASSWTTRSPFFDGQQANKEVYVPAANAYTGMTYTPLGQYYYSALTKQIAAINDGSATGSEAADALQEDVVAYAEEQGFTVSSDLSTGAGPRRADRPLASFPSQTRRNHDRHARTARRPSTTKRRTVARPARQNLIGWLFVGPFGIVFLALLVAAARLRALPEPVPEVADRRHAVRPASATTSRPSPTRRSSTASGSSSASRSCSSRCRWRSRSRSRSSSTS